MNNRTILILLLLPVLLGAENTSKQESGTGEKGGETAEAGQNGDSTTTWVDGTHDWLYEGNFGTPRNIRVRRV